MPLCVIAPPAITLKSPLPLWLTLPRSRPPETLTPKAPLTELDPLKVVNVLPAANREVPVAVAVVNAAADMSIGLTWSCVIDAPATLRLTLPVVAMMPLALRKPAVRASTTSPADLVNEMLPAPPVAMPRTVNVLDPRSVKVMLPPPPPDVRYDPTS